ncbi:hypothetical protein AVEN_239033-1 [Araneus ventricosus]|uniref:Uncharacterized protein n=1 Tax=Araneus ventricosus TaxID=182803 RepID=A0A4Y2WL66_ARAVE|nr:hypothetical protein AVEN_239033-1 [Araneus ventricosus]
MKGENYHPAPFTQKYALMMTGRGGAKNPYCDLVPLYLATPLIMVTHVTHLLFKVNIDGRRNHLLCPAPIYSNIDHDDDGGGADAKKTYYDLGATYPRTPLIR